MAYDFLLEPDIKFTPTLTLPLPDKLPDLASLNPLIFHLGLVELISYYKAACPPEVVIQAGHLNSDQIAWWQDLFIHGLGEFFYTNQIDFTAPDFLTLSSAGPTPASPPLQPTGRGDLILVGGGKDSAVTLQTLKTLPHTQVLMVNPTPAAIKVSQIAGYHQPIVLNRTLDPLLLQLNSQNYLNGHTPFSAYLAFAGLLTAAVHGYSQVITSNEASAGEASLTYRGLAINHQYSKSYDFEQKIRAYTRQYFNPNPEYFSFLRPLTELQIAALFSQTDAYDSAFSSCNVSRNAGWCGQCPKCAFVYLVLSAFLDQARLTAIFGPADFFDHPSIINHLIDLVGLGSHKPFDCVGSIQDSQNALLLALNRRPHPALSRLAARLKLDPADSPTLKAQIKNNWDDRHFLPPLYHDLLTARIKSL